MFIVIFTVEISMNMTCPKKLTILYFSNITDRIVVL